MSKYDEYEYYDEDEDEEFEDEEEEYEGEEYEYEEEEEEQQTAPRKPRQRRSGLVSSLTGGTFITTEIVGAMMHGGVLGVGAGILASAAVYLKGQDVLDIVQEIAANNHVHLPKLKGRSLKDRLTGNFPEEAHPHEVQDEPRKANRAQRRSKRIVLSPELSLERGEIVGKSIFVVGQRGSGKTTLGAFLAEQIGECKVPMFIPDSEGDLLSVYELLPRGVIAAAPGSHYEDDEDINFWAVTPEDADVLGFQILYEGMQVIFDMSTFEDEEEAWQIVTGVIQGLFAYAKEYPDQLCPVEVFLDEAQKYLPEDLPTSAIDDAAIRDALLQAYKDCSSTGRKRGITPVILSQRFAETNKKIIAQSEIRIIMRQTQDNDLTRCKKYVRAEVATGQDIASFKKGQGVFVGEDGTQLVTTFNQRKSDGKRSGTPGVEAVDRFANKPLRLKPPTHRAVRHEEEPHTVVPRPAPRQKADSLVSRGADAWMAGQQSIDKLAYALDLNFNQARQLKPKVLAEVKRRQMAETTTEEQA